MIETSYTNLYLFKDAHTKRGRGIFDEMRFYPKQVVKGRFDSLDNVKLLTPDIPLKTNKKGKPLSGKVGLVIF